MSSCKLAFELLLGLSIEPLGLHPVLLEHHIRENHRQRVVVAVDEFLAVAGCLVDVEGVVQTRRKVQSVELDGVIGVYDQLIGRLSVAVCAS